MLLEDPDRAGGARLATRQLKAPVTPFRIDWAALIHTPTCVLLENVSLEGISHRVLSAVLIL